MEGAFSNIVLEWKLCYFDSNFTYTVLLFMEAPVLVRWKFLHWYIFMLKWPTDDVSSSMEKSWQELYIESGSCQQYWGSWPCLTKVWCWCRNPFSQWQQSFHFKSALSLVERFRRALHHFEEDRSQASDSDCPYILFRWVSARKT